MGTLYATFFLFLTFEFDPTVCPVLLQSEMHQSLSANSPSMAQSSKIRMCIEPQSYQKTDGLAAHSAAPLHFTTFSILRWRILHVRTLHIRLSVQGMGENQECDSRSVLSGLKWLDHMPSLVLICSSRGWNGAHLVLVHLKPLWTSQSSSAVRRHEAAPLIYCSRVILCLWIKRQLNYGRSESWARAVGDGWGERTMTERQERWKGWDVWSFWLLRATSCSCKLFNMLMENRDGSAPRGQGCLYSWMLQKTQGQRWHAGLRSMIVGRCALQGSVQKSLWAVLCLSEF